VTAASDTPQHRVDRLVAEFVGRNPAYYQAAFRYITERPGYRRTANAAVALLGPVWFAARGLWSWFLPFLVVETFSLVQVVRGFFVDLGQAQRERARQIAETLETRHRQIEEAIETNAPNLEALKRAAASLENALADAAAKAEAADGERLSLILVGVGVLLLARGLQIVTANWALERRFTLWRSNRRVLRGFSWARLGIGSALYAAVAGLSAVSFTWPQLLPVLRNFPAAQDWRIAASDGLGQAFAWIRQSAAEVFDAVTFGIRSLLDGLEMVFVGTPWPITIVVVAILAGLSAGPRVAIFTVAALAYLGVLGFWEKAMITISLLGAAAMISITFGIPFGVLCARRPRLYAAVRPILDFMQSMPSFVYLIPVIAFFGAGKPAAVVATLIFGSPPVIRMTVLGLRQVPEALREAAMAFGATPRYLFLKVDLPLAAPTIKAGVNQTILLSLAMVVVASLIGAKGLGEDVLRALQYAAIGEGILAGLAILVCALIFDRIAAGRK